MGFLRTESKYRTRWRYCSHTHAKSWQKSSEKSSQTIGNKFELIVIDLTFFIMSNVFYFLPIVPNHAIDHSFENLKFIWGGIFISSIIFLIIKIKDNLHFINKLILFSLINLYINLSALILKQ